jgi:oligopeptide/dipeptide ABC transporter ATP-binding protein
MRAIQVTEFGGPEVLVEAELPDPEPADGMVLLETSAAGINYADTHQTENSYLAAAELPMIPGAEVVGTTPEGKRVVALVGSGGYAERVLAAPRHPYTRGLLHSVPGLAPPGARLRQIPGAAPSLLELPPGCAFSARCERADEICREMPPLEHGVRCHHPYA